MVVRTGGSKFILSQSGGTKGLAYTSYSLLSCTSGGVFEATESTFCTLADSGLAKGVKLDFFREDSFVIDTGRSGGVVICFFRIVIVGAATRLDGVHWSDRLLLPASPGVGLSLDSSFIGFDLVFPIT
jgi:hypothetical protein